MQPDVWQTFSVLSAQYLIVQDLFAPTDNPGKEPLLHSPSTYQHSTRAFTPLAIHSPTQYRSLCSTHHSCNNTVQEPSVHSPFMQQHGTGPFAPLTMHATTQYRSLCSTHQHSVRAIVPFIQQHCTRALTQGCMCVELLPATYTFGRMTGIFMGWGCNKY